MAILQMRRISICAWITVKGDKLTASAANAIAYGLYTVVLVYMVCDLPLIYKVLIVGGCNFVGVWFVKWLEQKAQRAKLWKIELTVHNEQAQKLRKDLDSFKIPYSYIYGCGQYTIFNVYAASKRESKFVKDVADRASAKYFVTETKEL